MGPGSKQLLQTIQRHHRSSWARIQGAFLLKAPGSSCWSGITFPSRHANSEPIADCLFDTPPSHSWTSLDRLGLRNTCYLSICRRCSASVKSFSSSQRCRRPRRDVVCLMKAPDMSAWGGTHSTTPLSAIDSRGCSRAFCRMWAPYAARMYFSSRKR